MLPPKPSRCSALTLAIAIAIVVIGNVAPALAQRRSVELQIFSDSLAAVGTQQEWMEMLHDVGADRVVVKTGSISTPEIEESQLSTSTLITVTGAIQGDRLMLPGGAFKIRDKAGIRELIQRLRDDGSKVALAEKKAFGLTSEQLVELHQTLSTPVNFSTKGKSSAEVVTKISGLIGTQFSFDSTASSALRNDETVAEELNGISVGTALAVVIRPLGLVLQPERKQGKSLELGIVDSQGSTENWPIGWPIEKPPIQIEPKLFERLQLEIRGFPLSDALGAIESRTGVPFLYDHNSFARHGVELTKMKVTLVHEKIAFMTAIGKLLTQNKPKLIDELRLDENGKPFLWITTQ